MKNKTNKKITWPRKGRKEDKKQGTYIDKKKLRKETIIRKRKAKTWRRR